MQENAGIRCYQETAVTTMGPEKLIVLLYEGLMRYLRQARMAIVAGDLQGKTRHLNNAQAVVVELKNALDHAVGGPLAANLDSLYNYLFHENINAMLDNDPQHIDNALRVLTPLLDAWSRIPPGTAERARREQESAAAAGATGPTVSAPGPVPASEQVTSGRGAPYGAPPLPRPTGMTESAPARPVLSIAV